MPCRRSSDAPSTSRCRTTPTSAARASARSLIGASWSDPASPRPADPMPGRAAAERIRKAIALVNAGADGPGEDERHAGVSHFIEHLFFKGTQRRPTSKEIADAIEGIGGFINASTDKELTAYWTRVPAERLELGLDVLIDIVSNSKLAPADVERERT